MRISHTDLDTCIKNPRNWFVAVRTAAPHGYKVGYQRVLRLALFHFHKSSGKKAHEYLDTMVKKHNLKNAKRVSEIENALQSYIDWVEAEHLKVADTKARIVLPLGFLELRGEISRIDVTPDGYRAILFGAAPTDWEQQLRMPLIQAAVSSVYGRPAEKIEVGFQELNGSNIDTAIYNSVQIKAAKVKFRALGETLRKLSGPKKKG